MAQTHPKRKTDARSIKGLIDWSFVLQLTLFEDLFSVRKILSYHLPSPDLDLVSAADLVESVITSISEKRNEEYWDTITDKAEALATKSSIPITQTREKRQTQPPRHLEGYVVDARTGIRPPLETTDDMRMHCFYPVIDSLISEMKRRFSSTLRAYYRAHLP